MDVLSDDLGSQYSSICTEEILNDDSIIRFGIEDTFSKDTFTDQLHSFSNTFRKQTIWGTETYISEVLKSFLLEGSYNMKTIPSTCCSNGHFCLLCNGTVPHEFKVISIDYQSLSEKCKWYLKTFAPEVMTILHKYFATSVTFHNMELTETIKNFMEINNSLISMKGSVLHIDPLKREAIQSEAYCEKAILDACDFLWLDCECTKLYNIKYQKLYHHFKLDNSSMSVLIEFCN